MKTSNLFHHLHSQAKILIKTICFPQQQQKRKRHSVNESSRFSKKKKPFPQSPCLEMALISAPVPVAKALVVGPGQMVGFYGCTLRLFGQCFLLSLSLTSKPASFLALQTLSVWFILSVPTNFGACKGQGKYADEQSTNLQVS